MNGEPMNQPRILVASNLSAEADVAVTRAFHIAHDGNAQLHIIHIADHSQPKPLVEQSMEFARRKLTETIAPLQKSLGIQAEIQVLSGEPQEDIATYARRWNADLIVLGKHRIRRSDHRFETTVAANLIRTLRRPLLMVARAEVRPYRTVVAGIDFSLFSKAAIRWAQRLAPEAEMHLVHAYQIPFSFGLPPVAVAESFAAAEREEIDAFLAEEMAWLKSRAGAAGTSTEHIHTHVIEGETETALSDMITQTGADLLAMGAHGRTGIARMLLGSNSVTMLAAASAGKFDIDILVVPAR